MSEQRKVTLLARSPRTEALSRWRDVHHWSTSGAAKDVPPPEPLPADNLIEIVERTTVEHLRSDGRRKAGTSLETAKRVVYRLHVEDVPRLMASLSHAMIEALDTRTWAQAQEPVPAVDAAE